MKKILLIQPKSPESYWTLQGVCEISKRPSVATPLALATIAALTPAHYEIEILDQSVEIIDFDTPCDLVGITGFTVQKKRMKEIAEGFKKRGKPVVAGGPFCSSNPDEAAELFDVVFVGEAERVWAKFLKEWDQNIHQNFYEEKEKIDLSNRQSPIPRWDLVDVKKYMIGMIQTSRGCPYDCEFCDVIALFGRKTRHKSVEQVVEEVQAIANHGAIEVFLADDNFYGNKIYSKKLLKALIEFNRSRRIPVKFNTQLTLNSAEDEEFLDLLKRANFYAVFIGIETPKRESLIVANKRHNLQSSMKESIWKFYSRGLMVLSGMIVGFDTDDLSIFKAQEEFLKEAGLMFPMLGILMAPRGTKLWHRLKNEKRLLDGIDYGDPFLSTNIIPKLMTHEELETNYLKLLHKVYSIDFFKQNFQTFIDQINVEEIKKDSYLLNHLNVFKNPLFYTWFAARVIWVHLIAGQEKRTLLFDLLKISIKKHFYCFPLALSALGFYFSFSSYVNRHSLTEKTDLSSAPPVIEQKKVVSR